MLPEHHVAGGTIKDKSEAEEAQEAAEEYADDDDEEDDVMEKVGMPVVPPVDDEAWVKDEL